MVVLRSLETSLDNAEQSAVPEIPWLMVEEGLRRLKEVGMTEWRSENSSEDHVGLEGLEDSLFKRSS